MIALHLQGNPQEGDLVRTNGTGRILSDEGLETLVTVLLFSDAPAKEGDLPPGHQGSKGGWWGDAWREPGDPPLGSRLWLLRRAKADGKTRLKAEEYASEALALLIRHGIAKAVIPSASYPRHGWLRLDIEITRPGNPRPWTRMWEVALGLD